MDPAPHRLTPAQARRVAVRAQLLAGGFQDDLLGVVAHLTHLQLDPTTVVAPSADLVARARLGNAHDPGRLRAALDDGQLVELAMTARPAADLALFRAEMAAWPVGGGERKAWHAELEDWLAANAACHQETLAALRADGPLPLTALPDTCVRPWRSSGWNRGRDRVRLLAVLVDRGEVAVAGRTGSRGEEKVYDLAERVYPDDTDQPVPLADALAERDRRRLAALGVARPGRLVVPGEPVTVGEAGEPAVVEGVRGRWRVDPAYLDGCDDPLPARAVLLSPLDRLVADRKRASELLGFDYALETYKPAATRLWGCWAMPVLHGDRLVGKLDATAERGEGVLRVDAVHEDDVDGRSWDSELRAAVDDEISALASWLGLDPLRLDRSG